MSGMSALEIGKVCVGEEGSNIGRAALTAAKLRRGEEKPSESAV